MRPGGLVPPGSIPACAGEARPDGRGLCLAGVYPRVCGGSWPGLGAGVRGQGLSPRVRGKRGRCAAKLAGHGSIPACAGEAQAVHHSPRSAWVYPRVCGGSGLNHQYTELEEGLSPRVRGKQGAATAYSSAARSIPACAGEAVTPGAGMPQWGVYPRVCGGSVQMTHPPAFPLGLSPRVRGKLKAQAVVIPEVGSIPACAGEARRAGVSATTQTVYPRVCGGSFAINQLITQDGGLSPRVRGKHRRRHPRW